MMGARDLSGLPQELVNRRRSGFACQKWSGEGAWVAFLRGVCRFVEDFSLSRFWVCLVAAERHNGEMLQAKRRVSTRIREA